MSTLLNKPQKFHHGDVVRIAKDPGRRSVDLPFHGRGRDAIILSSYQEMYGGSGCSGTRDYTVLIIETGEESCWFRDTHLTFIRAGVDGEIAAIMDARKKEVIRQASLSWIVANWAAIRTSPPGATVAELLRLCGIIDPFTIVPINHLRDYTQRADSVVPLLDGVLLTGSMPQIMRKVCRLRAQAAKRAEAERIARAIIRPPTPSLFRPNPDWVNPVSGAPPRPIPHLVQEPGYRFGDPAVVEPDPVPNAFR